MLNSDKEWNQFLFIQKTDRKGIYAQIKSIVAKAQEVAAEELQERSLCLKKMLDTEDKIYEEEFANKVKTRIDEDIRGRKDALHAIMEKNKQAQEEFLEKKRIQQVMESCYEIRERMRAEDLKNVKICQEEQIVEKLRQKRRNCEIEKFWREVENKRWENFDKEIEFEKCVRERMKLQMRYVLGKQVEEMEERREQERRDKEAEAEEISKVLEEMRLERFEKEHQPASPKKLEYRKELLEEIAARKAAREAEALALKDEHLALIRETQRLESLERTQLSEKKRELQKATLEYIAYVRRMRDLESGIEKMMNDRLDDLAHVDTCTKTNIAKMARLKAEEAARCHAVLKRQICEEAERRLRLKAEHRENKILENRFVHPEVTRDEILAQRRKNREDLDHQIIVMKLAHEEEEKKFELKLLKAIDDPEVCTELAEKYVREGVDYLPPHPNWRVYGCPKDKFVPRAPKIESEIEQASESSIEKCYCPKAARAHCEFMRTQGICEAPLNSTKRNKHSGDIAVSNVNNTFKNSLHVADKKSVFRSCECPERKKQYSKVIMSPTK